VRMGRLSNAAAVLLSIGAAYVALSYGSLMEYIQMILSTFNAPLFALVALAALAPRRVARGGLGGLAAGVVSGAAHQSLVLVGVLHYGSQMSANFYAAILSFTVTCAGTVALGVMRGPVDGAGGTGTKLVRIPVRFSAPTVVWAALIAAACVLFNVFFW